MSNKVDFSKPIQTRGGYPARLLCTNRAGCDKYPVVSLVTVEGKEKIHSTSALGKDGVNSDWDLVNVPNILVISGWLNLYDEASFGGGSGPDICFYTDREHADKMAAPYRTGCIPLIIRFDKSTGEYQYCMATEIEPKSNY